MRRGAILPFSCLDKLSVGTLTVKLHLIWFMVQPYAAAQIGQLSAELLIKYQSVFLFCGLIWKCGRTIVSQPK